MADRQSQGLQIALIAAVMLDIVFGVAAYLMWRQYDEARNSAVDSSKKASEAQQAASAAQADAAKLKEWMGFASTESVDSIGKTKDDEMNNIYVNVFGAGYPQADRVYRKVLRTFYDTILQKDTSIADAQQKRQEAETERNTLRADVAKVKAAEEANTKLKEEERDKYKTDFDKEKNVLMKDQRRLVAEKAEAQKNADAEAARLQGDISARDSQLTDIRRIAAERTHALEEKTKETFEVPLGKVISVNQAAGTVYINLGEADALHRLTTFAVYDAKTTDVSGKTKKASIEVTKVLDSHMAEARILDDKYGDPIITGDVIYTPIWKPGQQRHFALAGIMDINGDNKSELDLVRRLITMNGGVVDAVAEGDMKSGAITAKTDYLVIGIRPGEFASPTALKNFTDIQTAASRFIVKQIDLKDLLAQMGWKPETNLQRFGPGATSADFKPQPRPGAQPLNTGNVSPLFKPRQPRSATTGASPY